jgi:hypothetical protein
MNLELIKETVWSTQNENYQPEYSVKLDGKYVYVGPDLDKAKEIYHKIHTNYKAPTKEVLFQTTLK